MFEHFLEAIPCITSLLASSIHPLKEYSLGLIEEVIEGFEIVRKSIVVVVTS